MKRTPLFRILVPALVILHFFIHLGMGIGRGGPDLLTLALLLAARETGMAGATALGFSFGLLEDSFSGLAFGANTLALTLVGALGSRTKDLFVGDSILFFFSYLAAGKWVRDLVHWIASAEGGREPFVNAVLADGAVAAGYVAIVGLILVLPLGGREALR